MRIGINVPNELLQRVKAISPEVNVSQICREALESRAAEAERIAQQADIDGIAEQVLRLAQSDKAPLLEPDWVGMALEDAREWVRAVEPETWYDFWDYYYECEDSGQDCKEAAKIWIPYSDGKTFMDRAIENNEWFFRLYPRRGWKAAKFDTSLVDAARREAESDYYRTWLGYVLEAKKLLQQHFAEKDERMQAEREQNRIAVCNQLEPPPQMVEYDKSLFGDA